MKKPSKPPCDRSGSFADPAFVKAGEELKKLIDMKPFQDGFLGAVHDDMQATFGNGKAAMELSGQWAPSVQAANSADTKGVKNLGMFGFPAVEGGAGDGSDVVGGGNGFAIGKNASPEAIDFVKYLTSCRESDHHRSPRHRYPRGQGCRSRSERCQHETGSGSFAKANYFQLYYDQFLPAACWWCHQRQHPEDSSLEPLPLKKLRKPSKLPQKKT